MNSSGSSYRELSTRAFHLPRKWDKSARWRGSTLLIQTNLQGQLRMNVTPLRKCQNDCRLHGMITLILQLTIPTWNKTIFKKSNILIIVSILILDNHVLVAFFVLISFFKLFFFLNFFFVITFFCCSRFIKNPQK